MTESVKNRQQLEKGQVNCFKLRLHPGCEEKPSLDKDMKAEESSRST